MKWKTYQKQQYQLKNLHSKNTSSKKTAFKKKITIYQNYPHHHWNSMSINQTDSDLTTEHWPINYHKESISDNWWFPKRLWPSIRSTFRSGGRENYPEIYLNECRGDFPENAIYTTKY